MNLGLEREQDRVAGKLELEKNKKFNNLQLIDNTQINKFFIPTSLMEEGSGKISPSPAYISIKKFLWIFDFQNSLIF